MGLVAGIVLAVAFWFVVSEDWEDVGDFVLTFSLAFMFVAFAYGGLWLIAQLAR